MASSSLFLPTLFASLLAFQLFPSSSSSVITIPLYHIEHFIKSNFKDHNSLVLARLARDEARQKQLALIFNASHARSKYTSTPLSTGPGGGEYVALVRAGSQRQRMHLLLDTGSSLIWWQCQPCTDCYSQRDPIFNPPDSSSYEELNCTSDTCTIDEKINPDCVDGVLQRCNFDFSYADDDMVSGILVSDNISSDDGHLVQNITFGCVFSHERKFRGVYAGILGFDQGYFSFPSQVDAAKFSFCLVHPESDESSPLYLYQSPDDDYDDDDYDVDRITMSIVLNYRNPRAYYVKVRGVAINGKMVPIDSTWEFDSNGNNGVLIDTGTTLSRFPPEVYPIFRDHFRKEVLEFVDPVPPPKGYSIFDTCYNINTDKFEQADIPTVTYYFDNNKVPLRLEFDQIMARMDGYGTHCLAFAASKGYAHSVIGSFQLKTTRLSFDLSAQTISLYLKSCPKEKKTEKLY